MHNRITWLRSLTPANAVEALVAALRDGVPEDELWAVGALTATRYLNNQARNLLGFVTHALIGCEDARRLAVGQPAATRRLLIVQALYQLVCDLHDPCFAPFELLPFWPLHERTSAENVTQLRSDVRFGEYMRADHRFVGLERELPRPELVDLLLEIGLEGIVTDDHTLITPTLCLGLLDLVGWEQGFDMLRWALRYSASFPREFAPYDRAVALARQYGLERGATIEGFQPERVGQLRVAFHAAAPHDRPELAARALAHEGYAPETVLAAVALVGCDCYLMTEPVSHADYDAISREVAPVHMGTSTNALRVAARSMAPRTKALAAIQGGSLLERGPSVLNEQFAFVPFVPSRAYPYAEDVERLRGSSPEALLEQLHAALYEHDHRTATAAVQAYAHCAAAPEPLIALLTAVACTDNGTLLHSVKHLNALVKEFRSCNLPERWNFLAAAARFIAWYAGVTPEAYERAREAGV